MKSSNIKYVVQGNSDNEELTIVLKKKKFPWWIFLFLLPLLLLIPINKNANVKFVDNQEIGISKISAGFIYITHWPYNPTKNITISGISDDDGKIVFNNIKLPLYALIFCGGDFATISTSGGCAGKVNFLDNISKFPSVDYKNIVLEGNTINAPFIVKDINSGDYIKDANIKIVIENNGTKTELENISNENGLSENIEMSACAKIFVVAQKQYYQNDTIFDFAYNLESDNNRTLNLKYLGKSGDFKINLQWFSKADLDLHCICPKCTRDTIFYNRKSHNCRTGNGFGELDVDANLHRRTNNGEYDSTNLTSTPVENIYWIKPPQGKFVIDVVWPNYTNETNQTPYSSGTENFILTITETKTGEVTVFRDSISKEIGKQGKKSFEYER